MTSPSIEHTVSVDRIQQPGTKTSAPVDMRPEIAAACEMIAGRDCDPFLRLMRCVYFGECEAAWKESETLVNRAEKLGLLKTDQRRLTLTSAGYLVGNVAKEYCNYVEQGRQVVAPKPPVEFFSGKDVLDLGCSFGRWLWEFQRQARSATGIEMQLEYIQLGAALARREGAPMPHLIQDSIENLDRHIAPQSMDLAFSRLVFNYVAIKPTVKKAVATLRPGGVFWLEVGPFAAMLSHLVDSEPRLRSKVLAAFELVNSILCTATGRQMVLRVKGRMHSAHKMACPSLGWWRRTLQREGLIDFQIVRYHPHGVAFYARKPV